MRTPQLEALAAAAVAAMRAGYGEAAPVRGAGPDWTPHIAVAYGCADAETYTGPLPVELDSLGRQQVRKLLVVDHDSRPATRNYLRQWHDFQIPVDQTRFARINGGKPPPGPGPFD
jgi:hypothetical protein